MDQHFERMIGLGTRKGPPAYTLKSGKVNFQPSKAWQGPRAGFIFTRGPQGVGYYEDYEQMKQAKLAGIVTDTESETDTAAAKRRRTNEAGAAIASDTTAEDREEAEAAERLAHALENDEIDEETIRKILEAADKQQDVVELDLAGIKRLHLNLEKSIQSNLLKRVKFVDDPAKFVDSELELFEEIGNFKAVAAAPTLYPEIVKLNVADSLLGLVTHENTDISIAVLTTLAELTDPDTVLEAEKEAMSLIDSLVEKNCLELLVQNLQRMDESKDEDVKGIHSTLQVLENLCTVKPSLFSLVCEKTGLMLVLVSRIKAKRFDDTKAFCAELLATLLAADTENQRRLGQLPGINGMDSLLQSIAYYRRREAASPEEQECVENLCDALCSTLLVPENQARFRKAEGLDLMLRCIREKKGGFLGAVKAIDSALMNSAANGEKLIELGGLKVLFPLFMGRGWGGVWRSRKVGEREVMMEQVVSAVASLCMLVSGLEGSSKGGECEARLLAKFVEGEGEKVDRAVEIFVKYATRVTSARQDIDVTMEEQWQSEGATEQEKAEARMGRLMDAGLYMLQRISIILGYVWTHSREGRKRLRKRMRMEGRQLGDIADILRVRQMLSEEYARSLGQDVEGQLAEGGGVAQQRKRLYGWAYHLQEAEEERGETGGLGEDEERNGDDERGDRG